MKNTIVAVFAVVMLSGCYSMQGSERILDRDGMVTREIPEAAVFRADFERAYKQRYGTGTVPQADIRLMMESGFQHIYSYCDNYFDVMSLQQRKSRVFRDTIAPISALMTGVLALHNFEKNPGRKEDLLAVLGLATATTASALDIYDEHMLFGAENIGAVESLTKAALVTHSATALTLQDVSYSSAIRHLLDNQAYCSPQHILALTREAIKEGKVTTRSVQSAGTTRGAGTGAPNDGDQRLEVTIDNNQ